MDDRYTRGLATAVVRNRRELRAAKTRDARRYYQGCVDGLTMALAAAVAMSNRKEPWRTEDDGSIYEQVNIHIRLAEERTPR